MGKKVFIRGGRGTGTTVIFSDLFRENVEFKHPTRSSLDRLDQVLRYGRGRPGYVLRVYTFPDHVDILFYPALDED